MIVSCPSCDSKYQVADEKVAGNVLRTRCKACGSQILVDGTIPPPRGDDDDDDDVTRILRAEDHAELAESLPPASGNRWTVHVGETETRPMTSEEIVQAYVGGTLSEGVSIWKSGMASWASLSDVPELMQAIDATKRSTRTNTSPGAGNNAAPARAASANAPHAAAQTRTSKPPPPARNSVAANTSKASPAKAPPSFNTPKRTENKKETPEAPPPAGDFYSRLSAKIGSGKSQSVPPASEVKPANRPRATMPPSREGPPSARTAPGRTPPAKKEPVVADVQSNLDPTAAPGDFYAKILAKVRPQSTPPSEPMPMASARKTLPPPTWGAIAQQPAPTHEGPPSRHTAPPQPVPEAFDIPIETEFESPAAAPGISAANQAAVRRASPAPPTKRVEPVIPVDIQLPPMGAGGDNHPAAPAVVAGSGQPAVASTSSAPAAGGIASPSGSSVVVTPGSAPPVAQAQPSGATKVASSRPAAFGDETSPGMRAYKQGRGRRSVGTVIGIIAVGLLGVGGGVAATFYAIKSSNKDAAAAAPSGSALAGVAQSGSAQGRVADNSQPAQAPGVDPLDADELAKSGAGNAQVARGAGARRAAPRVGAAEAPSNPAETKSPIPAPNLPDSNLPSWLEKSADVKSKNPKDTTATATKTAPAVPDKPVKSGAPPFNRDGAMAILGIAAAQAPSCKRPGGPTGNGKALVTFDSDGTVVIANVIGEEIAGTPVARCVAGLFQRVKVAPFSGDRQTVSKPFTIPP